MYAVGVLVVLAVIADPFLRVWPFQPGLVRWRFAAVGFFSNSLIGVLFGMIWMIGVAILLDHRRAVRVFAALTVFLSVVVATVLLFFVLDMLQLRASVNPEFLPSFDVTVVKTIATLVIATPVIFAAGIAAWISARVGKRSEVARASGNAGLISHSRNKGGSA